MRSNTWGEHLLLWQSQWKIILSTLVRPFLSKNKKIFSSCGIWLWRIATWKTAVAWNSSQRLFTAPLPSSALENIIHASRDNIGSFWISQVIFSLINAWIIIFIGGDFWVRCLSGFHVPVDLWTVKQSVGQANGICEQPSVWTAGNLILK